VTRENEAGTGDSNIRPCSVGSSEPNLALCATFRTDGTSSTTVRNTSCTSHLNHVFLQAVS
jgi:hypothetical protein